MAFYEKNIEDLLNLRVGQKSEINNWSDLTRVPGGWVYNTYLRDEYNKNSDVSVACCFVPEPVKHLTMEQPEKKQTFFHFPDGEFCDLEKVKFVSKVKSFQWDEEGCFYFFVQLSDNFGQGATIKFPYKTLAESAAAIKDAEKWQKLLTDALAER